MTEVFIEGRLGKIVGNHHKFCCVTLREIFEALESNTGKFKRYLLRNKKRTFSIFIDDKLVDPELFGEEKVKGKKVTILPMLMGAVGFTIVSAIGTTALGSFSAGFTSLGFITAGLINAAFSFGLSLLISKLLAPDDPDITNTTSFVFGPPENVAEQGGPVPVGYGRLIVAGKIVSANSLSVDREIFENQDFYNTIMKKNLSIPKNNLETPEQGGSASRSEN